MNRWEQARDVFFDMLEDPIFFENLRALAVDLGTDPEPIPYFTKREERDLEGICQMAFGGFSGQAFYPSFEQKAVQIFYSIIKGHKLPNGNKRTASIMLLMLMMIYQEAELYLNELPKPAILESLAEKVAQSQEEDLCKERIFQVLFPDFKHV